MSLREPGIWLQMRDVIYSVLLPHYSDNCRKTERNSGAGLQLIGNENWITLAKLIFLCYLSETMHVPAMVIDAYCALGHHLE